ncbi:GAF domain-containing protein [Oceanispirochaeta crateris]|uniref:GAF domain-containing protein n=1 Tax=Oceanispirochaeta crateris TaxID=2518645 RepID=A0A5C1QK55_9SPIO|nr:sigma 54-interacting transcriptional regulator [Oceanispirochaeta crateris]QEN07569.1 GAF domain-containing protein [Oceanispirochaeta crateris]
MVADKVDRKRLDTLIEINNLINSNYTDVRVLMTHILESSTRLTGGESSSLLLLDTETDLLYFEIALGTKSEEVRKFTVKMGEGIAGWVAQNNTSLIVNDVENDPRFFSEIDKDVGYKTTSILAVPLRMKDQCVGVIEVINKENGSNFTEEDLEWLEIFTNQASLAYQNAQSFKKVKDELFRLQDRVESDSGFHKMIFKSSEIEQLLGITDKISKSDSPVLITGESGVGKELFAEQVHLRSPRSKETFVRLNCAAIPEELLESELFGHVKGAFTDASNERLGRFSLADGGTIFLDEIGEISLNVQAKLLRVLQNKQFEPLGSSDTIMVDVRIIAATNRNLESMVDKGSFREDLYYRLNVLPVNIPALRDRADDIEVLSDYFLSKYSARNRKDIKGISPEARELLFSYSWPGNVRELENVIERAVIVSKVSLIDTEDLLLSREKERSMPGYKGKSLKEAVNIFKKNYIKRVLGNCNNNQTETAAKLGIQRTYLSRLMKDLEIKV